MTNLIEVVNLMKETADREILPRFKNSSVSVKINFPGRFKEVVTEADINASRFILERVRPFFPGSYSEEHLENDRFDHDLVWQFDPIDGTQEFLEGMASRYAMHGALLQKLREGIYTSVAGIIYLPGLNKIWYIDENQRLRLQIGGLDSKIPELKIDALRGYVRAVDPNEKVAEAYRTIGSFLDLPVEIVPSGGSGSSFSDLLEGKLSLIIMNYDYTKEWDVAMAEPLVRARGGWVCDLDGNEFTYNRKDPYNRRGYVASIVFRKDEIMPHINPEKLLIKKL